MTVARSAAEVLDEHTTFELECVDRMYLNAYVEVLQTTGGAAWFFRKVRGKPVPSSALMAPMSRNFVAAIERFAERTGVELVAFGRRERKEERMRAHLRDFAGDEGVLFVGKAQEKTRVLRSERRQHRAVLHRADGAPWRFHSPTSAAACFRFSPVARRPLKPRSCRVFAICASA